MFNSILSFSKSFYNLSRKAAENDKITNINEFKKDKQKKEDGIKNKDSFLKMLFEVIDFDSTIEDGMIKFSPENLYKARKVLGFPEVPKHYPMYIKILCAIIDEPNPIKRKFNYEQMNLRNDLLSLQKDPKNSELKKAIEEEREGYENRDKAEFLKMAKRGWLRFENFNEWYYQFGWILENTTYDNRYLKNATEVINFLKAIEIGRDIKDHAILSDKKAASFPIGTKLYLSPNLYKIYSFDYTTKTDINEWISSENMMGSDTFIDGLLKNSSEDFVTLWFKPSSVFEQEFINFNPTEKDKITFINKLLKSNPELFLKYSWIDFDNIPDDIYFFVTKLLDLKKE